MAEPVTRSRAREEEEEGEGERREEESSKMVLPSSPSLSPSPSRANVSEGQENETGAQGKGVETQRHQQKQTYLHCQRCNKKKAVGSGSGDEKGVKDSQDIQDLPQHVTLNLHRVQGENQTGGASSPSGGRQSHATPASGNPQYSGHQHLVASNALHPSTVFATAGAQTAHINQNESYMLVGHHNTLQQQGGKGFSPRKLLHQQAVAGRFSGLTPPPSTSPTSASISGSVAHPSVLGMDESFVDVGTASHIMRGGMGARASAGLGLGQEGSVNQIVNLCTYEHAEKLNHIQDLLEKFKDSSPSPSSSSSLSSVAAEALDQQATHAEEGARERETNNGNGNGNGGGGKDAATRASVSGVEDKFLCGDCALLLQNEMERMIAECEMDCQAYQQALKKLEKEAGQQTAADPAATATSTSASTGVAMSEETFQREISKYKEEEQREERKVAELEKKLQQLDAERQDLDREAGELDKLEQRYWKQFNRYKLEMDAFSEEKEALVSKIESASSQLELLKRTNIYNDVFHIWHDGPFGTINSFRMGKTNKIQVEWDEINAAWGQAVLLLHTMASSCDEFEFSEKKLIPMGSYPKISDGKNTYELYGPVTQFLRANYDKAMCIFLQCLQEFAMYAKQYDIAHQTKPPFQLPYKIEGDKICGHTIRLRFNVNDKWTKALKYMLANLKVTLVWLTSSGPVGAAGREKRMA